MEEKQLDLNAPLLSVRRLSTTSSNLDGLSCNTSRNLKLKPTRQQSLPVARSQWEEEDTKPAAIPFIWEQIPGKAKDRKKPANNSPKISPPVDEQSSEDVNETLSMSFSWNYSEENSDMESLRSFSTDTQTRDYLMDRFLPAAKSMIVETPQYVSKKQEAPVPEPPKYVKKVYSGELRPLLLGKHPVSSVKSHDNDKERFSDVVEKKPSKKGFGFFLPRICTKRSSCLSNPTPAPKAKIHQSQSPVTDTARLPRLSRRTSYSGPLTPSIEKQAMDAVIRERAESRSKEVHETQRKSSLGRSGESLPSSPHRGLSRSGRISPYRNESPRSPFHDGARFLGVPKDVQNPIVQPKTCPSLNIKSQFSPRLMQDSAPVAEKTLYIDWMEKATVKTEASSVPPLPKSPSESWLWRRMTLRGPSPKKQQQQQEKDSKTGPKWETIVKTSNVHHDHGRYSEAVLNVSKYTEISF